MRISIMDSWNGKFSGAIKSHWESLGHTVMMNPTWEQYAESELVYFYQSDNTLVETSQSKKPCKGKVFAGCIDIEAWTGQPQAVDWSYVSGLTFIAEHIKNMVLPQIKAPAKVSLIKPGINLEKFPLKTTRNDGPMKKIAYVTGDHRIWDVKRLDTCLMMLRDLLIYTEDLWQLNILGSYSSHVQYNDYCEHLLDLLEIRPFVVWSERVENVSDWLEDKDYFMIASTKEAFSYATAEAMARGIKPVLGNWRGIENTWKPYMNKTYREMYKRFVEPQYTPEEYRKFVVDNYDEKRYFKELDEFVELVKGGE